MQLIDYPKLQAIIGDRQRVLILAPRRSGKQHFISDICKSVTNGEIICYTLTEGQVRCYDALIEACNTLGVTVEALAGGEENIREAPHVFLDEALVMNRMFIERVISVNTHIVAVSSLISEENHESLAYFVAHGFDVIHAPTFTLCEGNV